MMGHAIMRQNTFMRGGGAAFLFVLIFLWILTFKRPSIPAVPGSWQPSSAQLEVAQSPVVQDGIKRASPPSNLGSYPKITLTEPADDNIRDIQNSTLGFQKIFILSMPNRSDKRDALTLSAYLTGLDVEFIDGVNGSLVSEKAYPQPWKQDEPAGTIGCWRGHMEIYQKMVREKISTAMIMEDDVDWDVMIKAQMTEFARGTRYLQKSVSPTHSPYGDGWDILSTGHCGIWNKVREDQDYWVSENDPTVVVPIQREWWRKPNLTPPALAGDRSRVVMSPYQLSCLASYAVSLRGAARIIYDQAILPNAQGIDSGLGAICKRHEYGFNSCLAAYPMITGVHRPAGDMTRESDRKTLRTGRVREKAQSDNLMFPVRMNLGSLLLGDTVVKAQWPDHAMVQELDTRTYELPRGRGVFVRGDEYIKDVPEEEQKVLTDTAQVEKKAVTETEEKKAEE
ncbi:glycosyltransferase family 25 protein [Patellaria atrata CBS 101060]|uniref:Glycosyltransferase family 25 protein n=1 Tax=Patellaria atrata CBS 101060 TaxID=1346257 RepID=A0A9P4SA65_9PEZI|nr:glycosyltransferase family 25 protein [Patellaria atrata CBS 101060]